MNPTPIRRADSAEGKSELLLLMNVMPHDTEYRIVEVFPDGFQYIRFVWHGTAERANEEFSKILFKEMKWSEVEQKSPVAR